MATPLALIIRYISTAFSGCVLMMWGVINFSLQLRTHLAAPDLEVGDAGDVLRTGWNYSWLMAAVMSLIPMVIGVVLIRGTMKEANRARQLMG